MRLMLSLFICLGTLLGSQALAAPVNCFSIKGKACHTIGPNKLPRSVKEFKRLRSKLMKSSSELERAYGGASLFLYALMVRSQNKALGDKMVVMTLDKGELTKGPVYKGYTWRRGGPGYHLDRLAKRPHIAFSHAKKSTRSNEYRINGKRPVSLVFRKQSKYVPKIGSGKYKVFACTSGASTCRPIALRRNSKGIWKVKSFSSISVDIQAPSRDDGDDL